MKIKRANCIFAHFHLILSLEIIQSSVTAFDSALDYTGISHSALCKAIFSPFVGDKTVKTGNLKV